MYFARFRWLNSLTIQLLAAYLGTLALTLALIGSIFWAVVSWNSQFLTQRDLQLELRWLEQHLRFSENGRAVLLVLPDESLWAYQALPNDVTYRVIDASGQVLLAPAMPSQPLASTSRHFDAAATRFDVESDGVILRGLTAAIRRGNNTYYIQVASSDRAVKLVKRMFAFAIAQTLPRVALVMIIILVFAVYWTLKRVIRPLRDASAAAICIEPRNISGRITLDGIPSEFSPVIEAFNLALDRLEKGYRVQQEFLGSVAHELKTPLALVRGQVEMANIVERPIILKDLDAMARQVMQLLHLAEASETANYSFEAFDQHAATREVVLSLQRVADHNSVYIDFRDAKVDRPLNADRAAYLVLVKNLIENAIQQSSTGDVVTVAVGNHELCVSDVGPGIAATDLDKLFTRYWRGPHKRDQGAGLGLAICKEIAAAHDWILSARDTGAGAEFKVVFESK
jgi:two-component system sensor histidine kinase QseC